MENDPAHATGTVEYVEEKWGGIPHNRQAVVLLGEDDDGLWGLIRAGTDVFRGDDVRFVTSADTVVLFPRSAWWILIFPTDHPLRLYVNIGTPPIRQADRIFSIDTDLDVIVRRDGSTEIVDRDEFERHQLLYSYPPDVIQETERAAIEAFALASARTPPFDGVAAARWMRSVRTEPV